MLNILRLILVYGAVSEFMDSSRALPEDTTSPVDRKRTLTTKVVRVEWPITVLTGRFSIQVTLEYSANEYHTLNDWYKGLNASVLPTGEAITSYSVKSPTPTCHGSAAVML